MIISCGSCARGARKNAIVVVTTFVRAPHTKPTRSEAATAIAARRRECPRSSKGRAPLMRQQLYPTFHGHSRNINLENYEALLRCAADTRWQPARNLAARGRATQPDLTLVAMHRLAHDRHAARC